ncbi:sulfur oxidation c-type cytochrome SoxX [Ramlibacter terrae]|uniref:Sulfur oxidation c-type cytochrome SoxX n=1 Tax=Ramlibacter terrae TaxID=2732511 RepID=A0ABX6P6H6_9BURK|nr:sulfur oxidation c-type cytochrome SoxX [Ramlibacter terrae]
MRRAVGAGLVAAAYLAGTAAAQDVARYAVEGDAIAQPLTGEPGDAQRGRAIVANRQLGLCLLCHRAPVPEERFGATAPDLAGVGARYSVAQLRLRVVDPRRANPASFMPAFHSAHNPPRIGGAWAGKPILQAQQVEDVVAYLATLR